jgi:hypothetical protein
MKKTKQPTPAKKSIAQQHREERAKELRWTFLFQKGELNPCCLCGRMFAAVGLQLTYGPHAYACDFCIEELRGDLWKKLSEYRKRFVGKARLTEEELAARDDFVQPLLGMSLSGLYRRYVDWEKASTRIRSPQT